MLDLTGIMFSSVMMLMVIVRAVRLDRIQPWFQAIKRKDKPAEDKAAVLAPAPLALDRGAAPCCAVSGCYFSMFRSSA